MAEAEIVTMDIKTLEQFDKSLKKLSEQGLRGRTGGLSKAQVKGFWNRAATAAKTEAVKRAPASGKSGKAEWTKGSAHGFTAFLPRDQQQKHIRLYEYKGEHGWFRKKGSIRHRAWKTGQGVTLTLSGKSTKVDKAYTHVVGNFATWNVRRMAGGKSKTLNVRPWLVEGINAVGPRIGRQYTKLISDSLNTEIKKGQTRR